MPARSRLYFKEAQGNTLRRRIEATPGYRQKENPMKRTNVVVLLALCSFALHQTKVSAEEPVQASAGITSKELTLDLGENVEMKLVLIPAGKFLMGSPETEKDHEGIEGPQREVILSAPFYMGVHEVTQEQWETVMGSNPSAFKGAKNPVENVAWEDANAFCKKVSDMAGKTVRLPTEAQWEYACRAGTKTRFCYGDDNGYSTLDQYAWYAKNSGKSTHPVGQSKPNAWGLYDMHGNVWEWCSDWGCQVYALAGIIDPQGPASGPPYRVLRGGSWRDDPEDCRSAYRFRDSSSHRTYHYGFRVAADSK